MVDFVKHVERVTLNYLLKNSTQSTVSVLDHIWFCEEYIPPCLRICGNFFTQMILVGCFKDRYGSIPPHKDDDHHITALVSLGHMNSLNGGDTFYAEQLSDGKLTIKQRVPYQHDKIQIGQYGNVKHGAFCWQNGQRGVINCSLQKKLLNHFY